ncbi:MAG: hypothetical protein ABIF88_03140 [archaeon]
MVLIRFADENIKKDFEKLKVRDEKLLRHLINAIENIKEDPSCGIKISHKLIPKEWLKKYSITNLYKYNLPNAWRLLYSLTGSQIEIIAIILGCYDHKNYKRKFKY